MSGEPWVSNHALLRYIERVKGIDIEQLRSDILSEPVRKALSEGATGVTVNGVQMVAENGVIVTILADGMKPKKKNKRGWRELGDVRKPFSLAAFVRSVFHQEPA